MFNKGFFIGTSGVTKYYKIEFLVLLIIFTITTILLSFLFNGKNIFNTYQNLKTGFIPNAMYISKNNSNHNDILNKLDEEFRKNILIGYVDTSEKNISLNTKYGLNNQLINHYKIFLEDKKSLIVNYQGRQIPIDILRLKYNIYGQWTFYVKKLNIDNKNLTMEFDGIKVNVTHKKSSRRSRLIINLKDNDYLSFYKLMKKYIGQFADIDKLGIEKTFVKKESTKSESNELDFLRSKYDRAFEVIMKCLLNEKYMLVSQMLYDDLSNYRKKILRTTINDKQNYILDYINFPVEKDAFKNIDKFLISFSKKSVKDSKVFIFYYGENIEEFKIAIKNLNNTELIATKMELVPTVFKQKNLVNSLFFILTTVFTILVFILSFSKINSFYKAFSAELYFLKTYGFNIKLFSTMLTIIVLISMIISYPLLDIIYKSVNNLFELYFFPQISFLFNLESILLIYLVLVLIIFYIEVKQFNKLHYTTKDEL